MFIIQIISSFVIAGGIIALFTYMSEKAGGVIGGALSGLPVTVSLSIFFQALFIDHIRIAAAAPSILVSLSAFGVFCASYVTLYKYGFIKSLSGACAAWFVCAFIIIAIGDIAIVPAIILFLCITASSLFVIKKCSPVLFVQVSRVKKPGYDKLVRFLIGGGLAALTLVLNKMFGGLWGGVFSVFPAIGFSSLLILHKSSGHDFTIPFINSMFISASVNCSAFILGIYWFYPALGVIAGTLAGYGLSLISAIILYLTVFSNLTASTKTR